MIEIINECKTLINEIRRFSNRILAIGIKINDLRLEDFEKKINFKLPNDFKFILKEHNGISLAGIDIYGFDIKFKELSLPKIYDFEHFEVNNKMPSQFLPFSPDGRGNHYCLDLSKLENGLCPVVFWQWDYVYESLDEVEQCNQSFIEWVKEVMIAWTLEEFNYDGFRKAQDKKD